ncbi:MAG: hypothetical protein FJ278_10220, partial [Planctomycetes bacterium]|nr:hypothetical protein [Planctomycetota bacterium]
MNWKTILNHALGACLLVVAVEAGAASFEADTAAGFNDRAAKLQPGDELVLRNGVYSDWRLEIPCRGADSKPVVIRPQTPGGVLFRRATAIRITGDHVEVRGFHFEHCGGMVVNVLGQRNRLTECRFLWCGNPRSTFTHIVEIGGAAHDNRVDHCHFEGSKSMSVGLRINGPDKTGRRNRIDHNVFRDILPLSSNGQEAVQLGQGGQGKGGESHTLVEFNTFDNASGDPEFISNKSSRNVIRYNVAVNCNAALVLRGGDHCLVEGNVILLGGRGGIRIHGSDHLVINNLIADASQPGILMPAGGPGYETVERCLVAHNTVVNCKHGALAFSKTPECNLLPKSNRVLNNVFVGREGVLLDVIGSTDNEVKNNLFWPTKKAEVGFSGTGAVQADPLLVGLGAALRPQSGSPVTARALALAEVTRDRLGFPRPFGAAADLGADELSAEAGPRPQVELPPVPPARPPFDFDALKGEALFAIEPGKPMKGLVALDERGITIQDGRLTLSDTALWLAEEVPADFVAEWEYSPTALSARASVTFAAPGRKGGYTLGFGGARGTSPDGLVTLAKGSPDFIIADGHDTVLPNDKRPKLPDPKLWYRCRLVKRGGHIRLDFGRSPILIWDDTGRVGGPAFGPGALGLSQAGTGGWRNL